MKWLLKWTFRLVVLVVLVVAACVGYVYYASGREMARTYTVAVPSVTIPTDAASIARGKYLAEKVSMCVECHGEDLGGKVMSDNFAFGRIASANLTKGQGGIGSTYSDEDFVRALTHGVRKDGHTVIFMPSQDYHFSEADLGAVIAYVKSVPAVDRVPPEKVIGPMARALSVFAGFPLTPASMIDHANVAFAKPHDPDNAISTGEYLVSSAGCRGCHGPDLVGGGGPPPGAANITPVGIGTWTEQDFFTALREHKRPNGTKIADEMPKAFGAMDDADLKKIFAYLKTVPAKGSKSKNQLNAAAAGS
jgi:mono/diheme cytochrome c family protein